MEQTSVAQTIRDTRDAIAAQLDTLANSVEATANYLTGHNSNPISPERVGMMLKLRIAGRRDRNKAMGAEIDDPSWDLLLATLHGSLDAKPTSVTDLAAITGVPVSSTIRKLKELEALGLIGRDPDPNDARRIFVRLTAEGASRITAYLANTNATGA